MKTILIILTALLSACANSSTEGVILMDITTESRVPITADQICDRYGISTNKYGDHRVKIKEITGFEYCLTKELHLEGKNIFFLKLQTRTKEMTSFKGYLEAELDACYRIDTIINTTSIYDELMRTANELSKSNADQRYIVLISDALENTKSFSAYLDEDLQRVLDHPVEVERQFIKRVKPENLKGIKVTILFQPPDDITNERFVIMANFYKNLLERYNAHVTIQSNL